LIVLTTYPRSGQHLLRENIIQRFDSIDFSYSHNINENIKNQLITITRNPLDSIVSQVSMHNYYNKNDNLLKLTKVAQKQYYYFYSNILKNNIKTVIDYNYLNTEMEKIIQYIGKSFNLTPNNNNVILDIKDEKEKKHLVSSKQNLNYDSIYKIVEDIDLSKEFVLYKTTLLKAYPFNVL
jgi:hypothetical protein